MNCLKLAAIVFYELFLRNTVNQIAFRASYYTDGDLFFDAIPLAHFPAISFTIHMSHDLYHKS